MFGIGPSELLVIFLLALILFGPKRIPQIAKSLGKAMAELRKVTEEVKESIEEEGGLSDDLRKLKDPSLWIDDQKERDKGGS